jgi:hypothetical protein
MEQYVKLEELVDFLKICFKFKWGDENEDEIMARIMTTLYGFKKFTKEQIIRTAWKEAKYYDLPDDEVIAINVDVSSRYYGWQAIGNLVNRGGEVYIDSDDYEWPVTHWMPLPLKPEV